MARTQSLQFAPQWVGDLTNVEFKKNNVIGNFEYPENVPTYKDIVKFLFNCPLKTAFVKCPSVLYQNYLREFWATAKAFDPTPYTDENNLRPLREYLIKFSLNGGSNTP